MYAPFPALSSHVRYRRAHAACEMASEHESWSQDYVQLTPGGFVGTYAALRLPGFELYHEFANQGLHQYGVASPERLHFGLPLAAGAASSHFAGTPVRGAQLLCIGAGESFDYHSPAGLVFAGFSVDCERVCDVWPLYEREALPAAPVDLAPGEVEQLRYLLARVFYEDGGRAVSLDHPAQQRLLLQQLFDTVMQAIGRREAGAKADLPRQRARLVRDARDYLLAHPDEPVSVLDLCGRLGVSRRTLQNAFQDTLDVSPVKYLRAVRLGGVRRELLRPASTRAQVQDVAARWGFWHLSHFAEDYRELFGERPSETLASALAALG